MPTFKIQFESTSSTGAKSGLQGKTIQAGNASEAKEKVKASLAHYKIRFISCVKIRD